MAQSLNYSQKPSKSVGQWAACSGSIDCTRSFGDCLYSLMATEKQKLPAGNFLLTTFRIHYFRLERPGAVLSLMAGAIGGQNPAAASSAARPASQLRYTYSSRDSVFCFLKIHLGR